MAQISFIDFEKLDFQTKEELKRILYPHQQSCSAIQLPSWPEEDESEEKITFGFGVDSSLTENSNYGMTADCDSGAITFGGPICTSQEPHSGAGHQRLNAPAQEYVPQSDTQQYSHTNLADMGKSDSASRLYTGLKQERRNKKRRPPGYYQNREGQEQPKVSQENVYTNNTQNDIVSNCQIVNNQNRETVSQPMIVDQGHIVNNETLKHQAGIYPVQGFNPPGIRSGPPPPGMAVPPQQQVHIMAHQPPLQNDIAPINHAHVIQMQTNIQEMSISNQIYNDGSRTDYVNASAQPVPIVRDARVPVPNQYANTNNIGYNHGNCEVMPGHTMADSFHPSASPNLPPALVQAPGAICVTEEPGLAQEKESSSTVTQEHSIKTPPKEEVVPPQHTTTDDVLPQENNEQEKTETTEETAPEEPKGKSWADLFARSSHGSAPPITMNHSQAATNKSSSQGENTSVLSNKMNHTSRAPKADPEVVTVPVADDGNAKHFADVLHKHNLNHRPVSLQPRGLKNRANWCYVNATLQALLACPPFYHLMKGLCNSFPTLSRGPTSTPVSDSLIEFVKEFDVMQYKPSERSEKGGKGKERIEDIKSGLPFEPDIVYNMLHHMKCDSAFKAGKQEDAEEFLSCVLNGLHDEMVAAMNLISNDSPAQNTVAAANGDIHEEEVISEPEGEGDEDEWEQVGPKNKSVVTRSADVAKSPISEIFGGKLRATLHLHGAKESATLEPFLTIPLDIQDSHVRTVKEAMEGLVSKEYLQGYTCPKSKQEIEATRRLALEELPPVLILHLKYFVYDKNGGCQKVPKKIDFDVDLELGKELLSPTARTRYSVAQRKSYKLFAVVNHHGTKAVGGHYTSDIYHPGVRGWIRTDDSHVKAIPVQQVLKYTPPKVPYILCYRRTDLPQH